MDGLHTGVLAMHGAAEMHEAAIVEGGAIFGAGGCDVLEFDCQHGRGDFGILDGESAAEAAAAVGVCERHLGEAVDFGQKAIRTVTEMESADTVATGVVGDAVMEAGSHIFDAEFVDEEFAELVDAGQQGGELLADFLIAKLFEKTRVLVADHGDTGGGGNYDGLGVLVKADEAFGLRKGFGAESGVGVHLATAGLFWFEIEFNAKPLKQMHNGSPRFREERVVVAGDEK